MKTNTRLVGEFFLIVIGVLVALMVETALESRKDDSLGDEYIARIKDDITADRVAIENRIDFFSDVQSFSNDVLVWLQTEPPVDRDLLLASFYSAEVWPFITIVSTYDDLLSTGNIRLLEDIDLRMGLSSYHNKANASRKGWNPSEDYREIIRGVIPTDIQAQLRRNCPTTDNMDEEPTGFPPCTLSGVDYDELSRLFRPLQSDVQFQRTLTYRHSEVGVMIYLLTQQAVYADGLLVQIEKQ